MEPLEGVEYARAVEPTTEVNRFQDPKTFQKLVKLLQTHPFAERAPYPAEIAPYESFVAHYDGKEVRFYGEDSVLKWGELYADNPDAMIFALDSEIKQILYPPSTTYYCFAWG